MRAFCAASKCRDNDVANFDEFGVALVLSFTTAQIINGTWVLIFDWFLDLFIELIWNYRITIELSWYSFVYMYSLYTCRCTLALSN